MLSNEVLGGKEIKVYQNKIISTIQMSGRQDDNKRNIVVNWQVIVKLRYENSSNPALAG
jgi:hypothetical protein